MSGTYCLLLLLFLSVELVSFFSSHTLSLSWMIVALIRDFEDCPPMTAHFLFCLSFFHWFSNRHMVWFSVQSSPAQPAVHELSVMHSNLLSCYAAILWVGPIDLTYCHPHYCGWASCNLWLSFWSLARSKGIIDTGRKRSYVVQEEITPKTLISLQCSAQRQGVVIGLSCSFPDPPMPFKKTKTKKKCAFLPNSLSPKQS